MVNTTHETTSNEDTFEYIFNLPISALDLLQELNEQNKPNPTKS